MAANLIIYYVEDDLQMQSSFFQDLPGWLVKDAKLPIHIRYHSKQYFGSYDIEIFGDKIQMVQVPNIECKFEHIKAGLIAHYKKHYKKGKKNILAYAGHSHFLYSDHLSTKTDIFYNLSGMHAVIFDSCYTSHVNLLLTLIDRTDYVIACESASPYLGFLGSSLAYILTSKASDITQYKRIIDEFIIRNSPIEKKFKTLQFRTDAVLIDMRLFKYAVSILDTSTLKRHTTCKLEDLPTYVFYDLMCSTKDHELKKRIKKCIIYYRMNELNRRHYAGLHKKLSGLSISL